MMGNSMYDYIDKMDKEDLEKALTPPLTPSLQFNVSPVSLNLLGFVSPLKNFNKSITFLNAKW